MCLAGVLSVARSVTNPLAQAMADCDVTSLADRIRSTLSMDKLQAVSAALQLTVPPPSTTTTTTRQAALATAIATALLVGRRDAADLAV